MQGDVYRIGDLGNHTCSAPALHGRVEIELEKMFERYDVNSSLVVGANCLDTGRDNDGDPRLEHRLKVARANVFVNRGEEEAAATSTLGHDLAPPLAKCSLDRENNRVGSIFVKVLKRWEYEVRLTVNNYWLRGKRVSQSNEEFLDEQLESMSRTRAAPLGETEKEAIKGIKVLPQHFNRVLGGGIFTNQGEKDLCQRSTAGYLLRRAVFLVRIHLDVLDERAKVLPNPGVVAFTVRRESEVM